MKMLKILKNNILICSLVASFFSISAYAGDVPIERDFLQISKNRWIWLEKVGWHSTRIILGRGTKNYKNKIWSKVYETDGDRHTWEYAFFIKIKADQFIDYSTEKNPRVAISTYDMGNAVVRWAIVFTVKDDRLEIIKEIDGFNTAADGSLYK